MIFYGETVYIKYTPRHIHMVIVLLVDCVFYKFLVNSYDYSTLVKLLSVP